MSRHHEHMEKIKQAIHTSDELSDEEKSESMRRLEEWVLEDKAFGVLMDELKKVAINIEPMLKELGFL